MFDCDVTTFLDFVVPINFNIFEDTVNIDDQGRTRVHFNIFDLGLQFLTKHKLTVRQVAK